LASYDHSKSAILENKGGKEEIKKKGKIRTEIERKTKKETGERKMM
jgi:hypothetical protein